MRSYVGIKSFISCDLGLRSLVFFYVSYGGSQGGFLGGSYGGGSFGGSFGRSFRDLSSGNCIRGSCDESFAGIYGGSRYGGSSCGVSDSGLSGGGSYGGLLGGKYEGRYGLHSS